MVSSRAASYFSEFPRPAVRIPRMGLQRQPIQQFKGINLRDAPADLEPSDAVSCMNVRYVDPTDPETIRQRYGRLAVKSLTAPSGGVTIVQAQDNSNFDLTYFGAIIGAGDDDKIYSVRSTPTPTAWTSVNAADPSNQGWIFNQNNGTKTPMTFCMPLDDSTINGPQTLATPDTAATVDWVGGCPFWGVDMVYWRGRTVVIQPDRVFYSPVGDPLNATWEFIDIVGEDSSKNAGLLVHGNNLYLFKQKSIHLIYDNNTFANRQILGIGTGPIGGDQRWPCKVSHPNGRMYWWSGSDQHIHSSNGETDHVIESYKLGSWFGNLLTGQSPPFGLSPGGDLTNLISSAYMVVDPVSQSIFLSTAVPGLSDPLEQDLVEIVPVGKPGDHPIFIHKTEHQAMWVPVYSPAGTGARPASIFCTSTVAKGKIYEMFSPGVIGTDDGVAISSHWLSGWFSFIGEEPLERIRRVNFNYRGAPILTIESSMSPSFAVITGQSITPTYFPGVHRRDRSFWQARGANKKGRYHRFAISNSVLARDFELSNLEFVIRGGKLKR